MCLHPQGMMRRPSKGTLCDLRVLISEHLKRLQLLGGSICYQGNTKTNQEEKSLSPSV